MRPICICISLIINIFYFLGSLGVRGVGSSNLPVPTIFSAMQCRYGDPCDVTSYSDLNSLAIPGFDTVPANPPGIYESVACTSRVLFVDPCSSVKTLSSGPKPNQLIFDRLGKTHTL